MQPLLPTLNLRPSKYLRDDYFARFYEEAPLCIRELALLRDVSSRMRFYSSFGVETRDMLLYFDTPLINRFFKWMEFLLELRNTDYFESVVKGMLFCFKEQKLITQQTEFQFEQSKRFLMELDSIETKKTSLAAPKSFFLCVLICSQQPDLMVNSIKQLIYIQEQNEFDFNSLWFHLFFGENNPLQFLGRHLEVLSPYEFELMITSLSGESLRRSCQDRFPMSQKEQALIFSQSVILENPESQVLERYITAARLLKAEPKAIVLVTEYLTKTEVFKSDLNTFINDIQFWQSVLKILFKKWVRGKDGEFHYQMGHLLDYIRFQRYVPLRPIAYSVKGRTYDSMVRDMNEWHNLQDFHASRNDLRQRWRSLKFGKFAIRIESAEYRIEELNTGIALLKEGRKMKHCVFSYLNECVREITHVFSLKQREKQGYKHLVTIEVHKKTVVQAHSKGNGKVTELQKEVLEKWMDAVELVYDRSKSWV